jgi:hypothetical protein
VDKSRSVSSSVWQRSRDDLALRYSQNKFAKNTLSTKDSHWWSRATIIELSHQALIWDQSNRLSESHTLAIIFVITSSDNQCLSLQVPFHMLPSSFSCLIISKTIRNITRRRFDNYKLSSRIPRFVISLLNQYSFHELISITSPCLVPEFSPKTSWRYIIVLCITRMR